MRFLILHMEDIKTIFGLRQQTPAEKETPHFPKYYAEDRFCREKFRRSLQRWIVVPIFAARKLVSMETICALRCSKTQPRPPMCRAKLVAPAGTSRPGFSVSAGMS